QYPRNRKRLTHQRHPDHRERAHYHCQPGVPQIAMLSFTAGQIASPVGQQFGVKSTRILHRSLTSFSLVSQRFPTNVPGVIVWLMPSGYLPIFIFLALAILFPIAVILLAKLVRPSAPSVTKLEPYECGIKPVSDSRGRY